MRILLVDDDLQSLSSTRKILELADHTVQTAMNGREALSFLSQNPDHYDCIVTDVRMPEMTGIELLQAITVRGIKIPILLMTAYGTVEDAVEAMKKGAVDFLLKPFRKSDLLGRIQEMQRFIQSKKQVLDSDNSWSTGFDSLVWKELDVLVKQVALTDVSILIEGESGVGKERIAHRIHEFSQRRDQKFVAINCAAIPESLIEAELFGYEKGAFTGAVSAKPGLFEVAHRGTLLLDEIGDLPYSVQAVLLRVLQEGEVRRLGSTETKKVDVRVIGATHRNLSDLVKQGLFREDLRFRLDVVSMIVPPLRERREDIPKLIRELTLAHSQNHNRPITKLSESVLAVLRDYPWPGNIRELSNAIERAVVLCDENQIELKHLPPHIRTFSESIGRVAQNSSAVSRSHITVPMGTPLKDVESLLIQKTLELTQGDKNLTAKLLGITSRTIYRKMGGLRDRGDSE
ncbi:MAG: sigma-54-dependent Fis family transcriptional regulator [Xanthomonadaceae bacterium]|nr:sigma-54-dependent Fis family transcriptional regulator [Xanthomonadaceae bacterium]